MRNVIILGSGRSGTSMVAGTLSKAGYFMGERLLPPRDSNPKGFFEAREINGINETLIAQVIPRRPRLIPRPFRKWVFQDRLLKNQRWLARISLETNIPASTKAIERIRKVTKKEPFCFKDPRFSYTLPVWRPFLKNTVFLCVFRDPASTAYNILKECQDAPYLHSLKINFDQVIEVWTLIYSHILEIHQHKGEWLFIHYQQVLNKDFFKKIEVFTGAKVDPKFPDPALNRSSCHRKVPEYIEQMYNQLCELAEYIP